MRWIADKKEAKEAKEQGRAASGEAPNAKLSDQKQLESIVDRASMDSAAFQVGYGITSRPICTHRLLYGKDGQST